jgi:hypothetical protein
MTPRLAVVAIFAIPLLPSYNSHAASLTQTIVPLNCVITSTITGPSSQPIITIDPSCLPPEDPTPTDPTVPTPTPGLPPSVTIINDGTSQRIHLPVIRARSTTPTQPQTSQPIPQSPVIPTNPPTGSDAPNPQVTAITAQHEYPWLLIVGTVSLSLFALGLIVRRLFKR